MQNTTDILADYDSIQAIVAVVFMVIAALGGLLKKKMKPGEGDGKTIIIPPPDARATNRQSGDFLRYVEFLLQSMSADRVPNYNFRRVVSGGPLEAQDDGLPAGPGGRVTVTQF